MMLNNLINSIIAIEANTEPVLKKMCFFKITALHSCQLELRPKPNNLCIKNVALQLATTQKNEILC